MITLYKTEFCPMCKILAQKMEEKHIAFTTIQDPEILRNKNITHVPILEVENNQMNFPQALKWVEEHLND